MAPPYLQEDTAEREVNAHTTKSVKLQDSKRISEKLEEREKQYIQMGLRPGDRPFETHEYIADEENTFLTKIFPIFLMCAGILIIIMSVNLKTESVFPLYLGAFVAVLGAVWHILATISTNKKKKKAFLRQRLD